MAKKIRVSVIIPVYNRVEKIKKCLDSVFKQGFEAKEVIVVDDASTECAFNSVKDLFPEIILISHKKRLGACMSRNEAVLRSKGDYLWFLDSDSVAENSDCLSKMIEILESTPGIGCLGGEYIYSAPGKMEFRRKSILANGETLTLAVSGEDPRLNKCDFVATCNCIIKKSLFEKIGGFDPKYFILSEDCELGYKVAKEKLANFMGVNVSVFHDIDVDGRKCDLFRSLKNRIRFVIKNFDLPAILLLPLNEAAYIINTEHRRGINRYDVNILKHIPSWARNLIKDRRFPFAFGLILIAALYLFFLLLAYLWNIVFLPQTIFYKYKKSYLT
ncbi:MAG: glycosyltransferase family 2 protein [Candidatus Omnitrophica bacterium]|nr:glycosyltransferase family 2 protein [Candidatus Omnitrophota bacterium]